MPIMPINFHEIQKTAGLWWDLLMKAVDSLPKCVNNADVYFQKCGVWQDSEGEILRYEEIFKLGDGVGRRAMEKKIGCDDKNARKIPFCESIYLKAANTFYENKLKAVAKAVEDFGVVYNPGNYGAGADVPLVKDLETLVKVYHPLYSIEFDRNELRSICIDSNEQKMSESLLSRYITGKSGDAALYEICNAKIFEAGLDLYMDLQVLVMQNKNSIERMDGAATFEGAAREPKNVVEDPAQDLVL